ncbi:amino acid ABC transporter permease [Domibacillus sp. PGB-M46]|uniref:amino acid ABC transporter permease n=1 Tax=Domibacillus sp. PGB-M46 TaxID=2910255 RepID=UPI001F5AAD82|nr:amino acid ABC transporter permease [Domibacillus sp. PGB-M46]MCI2255792.1 amino acid ABC transporter permease [Domibacillus sp. PGB-M46]
MIFDFSIVPRYGPALLEGFLITLFICFIGLLLGLFIGGLICWLKIRFPGWGATLANTYIEFFRNTPFLIQVFLLYYVGPVFGISISAMTAGILGLGLYGGAYFAEIYRSGILSVHKGQAEAARALGMGEKSILYRIVIPQMWGLIMAPLTSQIITLVKESAILSVITVQELTFVGQRAISETYNYVEIYTLVAFLYWALVTALANLLKGLENYSTRYLNVRERSPNKLIFMKKQDVKLRS